MSPIRGLRYFGNYLGLAWWAKIQTKDPVTTYWFGPFLTRRSLNSNLNEFIQELSKEGNKNISHEILRCRKGEPLTS
tara:strand:+ start:105 stop:335 length:231 start_codon:yes stop_codon:yes gene_type:complete